ncbi:unnamed protein product [Caenorhabditis auriculariae]|uniref:Homeobox domain-containing protein n=1 Tax=Caenorhabditis auriculariae TaxID=2777116 RepID=A0A8S1H7T2_9PELO|nr:unnamed protein product [Caenorhabditis auriculariae]
MSSTASPSGYVKVVRIKDASGAERCLNFPVQLDLDRPKRPRTTFTIDQVKKLEDAFNKSGYLSGEARVALAAKLGLSDTQVKVWFQNRRTKKKRNNFEGTSPPPKLQEEAPQMYPFAYYFTQQPIIFQ